MNLFIENDAQYWPNSGPVPAIINGPIQGHNGNAGLILVLYNPFKGKLKWPNIGPVPAINNGPIPGRNGSAGLMLVSYNPFKGKLKWTSIGPVPAINNGPIPCHNGYAMAQYWQFVLAQYRRRCAKLNVAVTASLYWANAPALIGPILAHYWHVCWV